MDSIYGEYKDILPQVMEDVVSKIKAAQKAYQQKTGFEVCEHLEARIKEEDSMRQKCVRRDVPETPHSALKELQDSIGIRVVCGFRDDIYVNADLIRKIPGIRVVQEKDYVRNAKPNGYRSYHMILEVEEPFRDIDGDDPGHFFVEVQLRTIAMDSWAALEHQIRYKQDIGGNVQLIENELKRCADELASCDVSMQTIRDLIRHENAKED